MKRLLSVLCLCSTLLYLTGCGSKPTDAPTETPAASPAAEVSKPQIIDLTAETFEAFIQSETKVLVDFWAPWCPPCRRQGEMLHEWAEAGKLPAGSKIGKVNVDNESALADRYHVQGIPMLLVFQNGEIVESFVGMQDEATIVRALGPAQPGDLPKELPAEAAPAPAAEMAEPAAELPAELPTDLPAEPVLEAAPEAAEPAGDLPAELPAEA